MSGEPENLRRARATRKGRGKLSSIEILVGRHPEVEPDLVWALGALRDNKLPQTAILAEFNERLADRGLKPISKGSWSRYAVRKALQFHKMDEARRIAGELVAQLDAEQSDQMTIMVAEMIKTAAFHKVENGEMSTKELMELSRSLSGAVASQKGSAELRRQLQKEIRDQVGAAIDKAIEQASEAAPGELAGPVDQTALLQRIREDIYGIFTAGENE